MLRAVFVGSLLAACGNDVLVVPDAPIVVDAALDAPACASPEQACGDACTDVASDEANCGACGVACQGGEACTGACACPGAFVPATIEPGDFDQFQAQGAITLAIAPTFGLGTINPFLVGYTDATPRDTDLDLATVPLGEAPFVAAAYGYGISTMKTDAAYVVTAGTLRLTTACGTEAEGTLTNATFQGVTGGLTSPQLDPLGCTFTVAAVAFHVRTAACP